MSAPTEPKDFVISTLQHMRVLLCVMVAFGTAGLLLHPFLPRDIAIALLGFPAAYAVGTGCMEIANINRRIAVRRGELLANILTGKREED